MRQNGSDKIPGSGLRPVEGWRTPWRGGLILAALLLASWSLAAGGDAAVTSGVPFRIGLDLGPKPERGILGWREVFTPADSLLALGTLLEHVGFRRVPWPEPSVHPMEENLPAVWLPLDVWRFGADGKEVVSDAAILIRSPRLRFVPTPDHLYLVLLQYVGPGEMAEPLRIAARPHPRISYDFRTLVISFKDFLTEGGDLPPEIVIAGELILEDRTDP